jgi:hypothetical protein
MVTATPTGGLLLFMAVVLIAGAVATVAGKRSQAGARARAAAAPFNSLGALSAFVYDDTPNNLEASPLAGPQPREDRRGEFHSSLSGAALIPSGATGPGGAVISDPGAVAPGAVDASAFVLDGKSTDDVLARYADRRHARYRRVFSQSNSPQRFEITRRLVERELRTAKITGAWWEAEQ